MKHSHNQEWFMLGCLAAESGDPRRIEEEAGTNECLDPPPSWDEAVSWVKGYDSIKGG